MKASRLVVLAGFCLAAVALQGAAAVYYVDAARPDDTGDGLSWGTAKRTVGAAITAATLITDEIWVKAGTYPGPFTLGANDSLYGGFAGTETLRDDRDWDANLTILSGDNDASDTATVGDDATIVTTAATTTLDGFRIQNAWASAANSAAVVVNAVGPVTIRNCTFYRNHLPSGGQAAALYYNYTSGSSAFTLDRCRFIANSSAQAHQGTFVLRGAANNMATVKNCLFSGNTAGSGGTSCGNAFATLAGHATGPLFVNCTFAYNTGCIGQATLGAAGSATVGSVRMRNCIFYGQATSLRIRYGSTQLRYENCAFQAYPAFASLNSTPPTPIDDGGGVTSFAGDPLFVDANGADNVTGTPDDDLHIQSGSPCKDAGTATDAPADDIDGDSRPQPLAGSYDIGADEFLVATYAITLATVPTGLQIEAEGDAQTAPHEYTLAEGSRTINAPSPQAVNAAERYVFDSWSDAGAQSHAITVSAPATHTATFDHQYLWTVITNPVSGGSVTPLPAWYDAGATFMATAVAEAGFEFDGWTGDYTSSDPSISITMDAAKTVTATFVPAGNAHLITIDTDHTGLEVEVDGVPTTGQTYSWDDGTDHTLSVPEPIQDLGEPGIQYAWVSWSDAGAATHDITALADTTITAHFKTQYLWTVSQNLPAAGTAGPATGVWYDRGSGFNATATVNPGYRFLGWSGTLSGEGLTLPVSMTGPVSLTADFVARKFVDLDATGSGDGNSWADAYTDLQTGLAAVSGGGELFVAEGTYKPGALTSSTFAPAANVALYGGFAGTEATPEERVPLLHPTILSGDLNGNDTASYGNRTDNANTIVTITAAGVVLDGFVLSGGQASAGGGAISCDAVSPTIANCIFANNKAVGSGGAIALLNAAAPTIQQCVFSDHQAAAGGAIDANGGSFLIERCVFAGGVVGDNGGALFLDFPGAPVIRNSLFVGNRATFSGAVRIDAFNGGLTPVFANCTFSGNRADSFNGSIYSRRPGAVATLTNCISYGNSAVGGNPELVADTSGILNLYFTDYAAQSGCTPVTGNLINQDPLFVGGPAGTWAGVASFDAATRQTTLTANGSPGWTPGSYVGQTLNPDTGQYLQFVIAGNGTDSITVWGDAEQVAAGGDAFQIHNHRIDSGSPCKNVGDNTNAADDDLDGVVRPQEGTVDMGAHEYIATVAITVTTTPAGQTVLVNGSAGTTPLNYAWLPGSQHTLSAPSPQAAGPGTRYRFDAWSDGGAQAHAVTVTGADTYTATLELQYLWSVSVAPGSAGSVAPTDDWYDAGASFTATATPNPAWDFDDWTGDLTGSDEDLVVTMNSPITVVANFNPEVGAHEVTVQTAPPGLDLVVDSAPTTGFTYAWDDGTLHTLSVVDAIQSGGSGIRYVWQDWSDGGAQTHDVTSIMDTNLTANFETQYQWTLNAGAGGSALPATAWYAEGSAFAVVATPDPGYRLVSWSGDLSGSALTQPVTMSGPLTVTATFAAVRYVDQSATGANDGSSWADAYVNLQTALAAVSDGELWVAEGTYTPGTLTTDTFLLPANVTLYGGFAGTEALFTDRVWQLHPTVLSGDLGGNDLGNYGNRTDNAARVVTIQAAGSRLDGFVISGGQVTGNGAGVYISGAISPVIANCLFVNNRASNSGAALWSSGATPLVTNCVFSDNQSASSAGAHLTASSAIFDKCIFSGGNVSDNGGALRIEGTCAPLIRNSLLVGNRALYAGAVRTDGDAGGTVTITPEFLNCTFSGNRADQFTGSIYSRRLISTITLRNCISHGNSAGAGEPELTAGDGGTITVSYGNVAGDFDGTGNISSDPLFAGGPGGTWADVGAFNATTRQTTLNANGTPGWTPGAFAGMTLNPDTSQFLQFVIAANDADSITVWGDAAQVAAAADAFQVNSYRIGSGSECRDSGNNTGAPADDLDGVPRPQNATTDMGAYEYIAGVSILVDTVPSGLTVVVDGSTGTTPLNYTWIPGSSHAVAAPALQPGHEFVSWSDAGAREHTVTVSGTGSLEATFAAINPATRFMFQ